MTTGGPIGERPVTAPQLLDLCDQALGEVSRRHHLFGWLRAPGIDDWLPVDAYYPGNRLVVVCRERSSAGDELIDELVPEHGLRLLRLAPGELTGDPEDVRTALRRRLDVLGPPPPRPRAVPVDPGPGAVARTVAALAQRELATPPRRLLPRSTVTPPREAVTRGAEFVAARREEIDELAHAAAVSRHRQPLGPSRRQPMLRRTSGPAASRGGAPTRATRRHPATAALLIAVLVIVVVVAVAIVSAAHGG
jgi:hypothetical protein